jgi:hypothetical protein
MLAASPMVFVLHLDDTRDVHSLEGRASVLSMAASVPAEAQMSTRK